MSSSTPRVTIGGTFSIPSFFRPVGIGEIGELVAVVVDVVDAEMAESVELAADADPAVDDVVVISCLVRSKTRDCPLVPAVRW